MNVSTPLTTNFHNRALEEHRRLFGFSAQSIGSYATSSSGKRNRGKTGKTSGGKGAKKPKVATWTHAFMCLAKKSQVSLPSPQERYKLKCVGLGEKKITVEVKDSGFEELYNTLLDEFPLLEDVGGIELMRTGFGSKNKTLEVIPTPYGSTTYNIVYLKEVLQQAKCYVRPIQRDIPIAMQGTCTSLMGTASVKVRLHNFDALFLFGKGILGYG